METPILITGHSLGGNLATIYASWLWWEFNYSGQERKNMNVISFAAPAAGDKTFANQFNKVFPLAERFEIKGDMVPKFPGPRSLASLGDLYEPGPDARKIEITYKGISVSMAQGFSLVSKALQLAYLIAGTAPYEQAGKTRLLQLPAPTDTAHTAANWFTEAAHQHGVKQYAKAVGAPDVICTGND